MADNPKNDPNEWDDDLENSDEFDGGSLQPPGDESMFIDDEDAMIEEEDSSQSMMPGDGTTDGDSDVLIEEMEDSSQSMMPDGESPLDSDIQEEEEDSSVSVMPAGEESMMVDEDALLEEDDSSQSMMPGDGSALDSDIIMEDEDSSVSVMPAGQSPLDSDIQQEEEDSSVSVMPASSEAAASAPENMEDSSESVFPSDDIEPEEPSYSVDPGSLFIAESEIGEEQFAYPGAQDSTEPESGIESDTITPDPTEDDPGSLNIDDEDRSSSLQVPAQLEGEGTSDELSFDTIAAVTESPVEGDITMGIETVDTPDPMLSDKKKLSEEATSETIQDPEIAGGVADDDEEYPETIVTPDAPPAAKGEDFVEDERYRQTFQARTADGSSEHDVVEAFRDPTYVPVDESELDSMESSSSAFRSTAESNFVIQPRSVQTLDGDLRARADFEFLGILGEGGMGTVYRARQKSLERDVALKMVKQFTDQDLKRLKKSGRLESAQAQRREQFVSEAVVTGALDHPNIVPIFDIATTEDGELFYSMRRVIGEPWSKAIKSNSEAENLDVILRTSDAIAFAHSRGVVHRDLKPENIFLGDYGEVVVMDWGLAVVTENFSKEKNVAPSSGFGGSPAYMAPEMGVYPNPRITEASDIYLLGAILFEIITGRPPHAVRKGASLTEISQMVRENRIRKVSVTGELIDIAYKAMETLPEDRYSSVQEFQKAIRAYQSHTASLVVFDQAKQDLDDAKKDGNYDLYQRSVYGMEEAVRLWDGNEKAKESLVDARLDYAKEAGRKENYELGLSLLSNEEPAHADAIRKLETQQRQRDNRKRTVTWLTRSVAALLLIGLVGVGYSYTEIQKQVKIAKKNEKDALVAKADAEKQKGIAEDEAENARKAEKEALDNFQLAETQREKAEANEMLAKANEKKALDAQKETEMALAETKIAQMKEAEERKKAETAQKLAETNAKKALDEQKKAEKAAADLKIALADTKKAQMLAEANEKKAIDEQKKAEKAAADLKIALADTKKAQTLAETNEKKAIEEQKKAEAAQMVAENARNATQKALDDLKIEEEKTKYESYVAQIGLIKARIDSNEFDDARRLLEELIAENKKNDKPIGWELKRLKHLVDQSESKKVDAPVTSITSTKNFLFAGLDDGTSKLFQIDRSNNKVAFQPFGKTISNGPKTNAVAISPNETLLATAGDNSIIKVWDPKTGDEITKFQGHDGPVRTIKFVNENKLVSGGDDRTIRLWDMKNTSSLSKEYHYYPVHDISLNPQGTRVATALASSNARGGRVVVWDLLSDGKFRRKGEFNEHRGPVYSVAFSTDGRTLVSAGIENSPRVGKLPGTDEDIPRGTGLILKWNVDAAKTTTKEDINKLVKKILDENAKVEPEPYDAQILGYHADAVRSLDFSDDGSTIASSGDDFTVKLWRIDGTPVKTLRGHGGYVRDATFLPESAETIVSGGFDKKDNLRVWNSNQYAENRVIQPVKKETPSEIEGHDDEITYSAFDRAGKRIITTSRDQTAKLWDAETGEEIITLQEGHELVALHTEYFTNGKYVMTAGIDQTLKLWDSAAVPGRELASAEGIGLNAYPVISKDDKWILTGSTDDPESEIKSAKLWSVDQILKNPKNAPSVKPVHELVGHALSVTAVAISDDSKYLLTGDREGIVILWDRESGKQIGAPMPLHGEQVNSLQFVGNDLFLSGSEDSSLTLTSVSTRKTVNSLSMAGAVKSIAVSPNGDLCFAVHSFAPDFGDKQNFRLVRFTTAEMTSGGNVSPAKLMESKELIRSISFSQKRSEVMTAQDNQIRIWSTKQQTAGVKPIRAFRIPKLNAERAVYKPSKNTEVISTLAGNSVYEWSLTSGKLERTYRPNGNVSAGSFSSDGKYVVTASRSIRIWNVDKASADFGKDVFKKEDAHSDFITSIQFSPVEGNNELVTTSRDGTVKLWNWDAANQELKLVRDIVTKQSAKGAIEAVAFSNDGSKVGFAGASGMVFVWNRQTPDKLAELKLDENAAQNVELLCVAFSQDGKMVFAGGSDNTGRLWNLDSDSQTPAKLFQGHAQKILSAAFIGKGDRLLTGSDDKSIRLWDVSVDGPQGRELLTLGTHTSGVSSVDVDAGGTKVMTSGNDGLVKIWPADGTN